MARLRSVHTLPFDDIEDEAIVNLGLDGDERDLNFVRFMDWAAHSPLLMIAQGEWEDMGKPQSVTVTIEAQR